MVAFTAAVQLSSCCCDGMFMAAGGLHWVASVQLGMEQQAAATRGRWQQCAAHIQGEPACSGARI